MLQNTNWVWYKIGINNEYPMEYEDEKPLITKYVNFECNNKTYTSITFNDEFGILFDDELIFDIHNRVWLVDYEEIKNVHFIDGDDIEDGNLAYWVDINAKRIE